MIPPSPLELAARPSTVLLVLGLMLAACGGRSDLQDPTLGDGGAPADRRADGAADDRLGDLELPNRPAEDLVPVPPPCGAAVPVGELRFRAPDIVGQVAIGEDQTIYAPRRTPDGGLELVAFDPCGLELWTAPASAVPTSGYGLVVRLSTSGEVLLTHDLNAIGSDLLARVGLDGTPRPPYDLGPGLGRFLALPPGGGPVAVEFPGPGIDSQLVALDSTGARLREVPGWSNQQECAMTGEVVACVDRAYHLGKGEELWRHRREEILDGTLRNAVGPALVDGRMYVGIYGIGTYALSAMDLGTGDELWRAPLASATGQSGLLFGGPVVAPDGRVFVYVHVGGRGELTAWSPDGTAAWSFRADATRERFFASATHVVGRAGLIYLAVGETLRALDTEGNLRWQAAIPAANPGAPVLSPNGDLALHTDGDELLVFATGSAGPAPSPWPAPWGGSANRNAR